MKSIILGLAILSGIAFGQDNLVSRSDFVDIRCDVDSNVDTYYEWYGEMFSQVPGERQKLLFNVVGMNVAKCFKRGDKVYQTTREIQMYVDPYTGKIVDQWTNPWTGETIPVMHVANSPVQVTFYDDFYLSSKPTAENRQSIMSSIPLTYPNPLYGDDRFKEYDPYPLYHATELFQYHFNENNLKDVGISWTRVSRFLPWMKMADRPGSLIFHTIGKRVKAYADLHPTVKLAIETRVPNYKYAPTCPLENRNETSWTYFKKHFDSYLKGNVTFPIDLKLEDDICKKFN